MNNHRLSTNKINYTTNLNYIPDSILNIELIKLLKKSNVKINPNGKVWIKSLNSYLKGGTGIKIEIYSCDINKEILTIPNKEFNSIREAAIYFKVSDSTISNRLLNNKPLIFEGNMYYFKRKINYQNLFFLE
jgi:hypothetical protein